MRWKPVAATAAALLTLAAPIVAQDQPAVELKPGDVAPAFSMAGRCN